MPLSARGNKVNVPRCGMCRLTAESAAARKVPPDGGMCGLATGCVTCGQCAA